MRGTRVLDEGYEGIRRRGTRVLDEGYEGIRIVISSLVLVYYYY